MVKTMTTSPTIRTAEFGTANTSTAVTPTFPNLEVTIGRPDLNTASPFSAFRQPLSNDEIAYLRNLNISDTPPSSPDSCPPSPNASKERSPKGGRNVASADLAEGETFNFRSNVTPTPTPNTDTNAQAFVPRFSEPRREPKLGRGNERAKQLDLLITIWEELEEQMEAGEESRGRTVRTERVEGRGGVTWMRGRARDARRRSGSRERLGRGCGRRERRERE